jgi:autotransporter translocation and assembly factor TamB
MSYKSNFDEFLAMFTNAGVSSGPSSLSNLRLALHVEGGRNITIQNQLADVEARVDLDVKGSVGNPSLTGHVEASGGTLSFQGKRYTITRGNVDFVDPLSIEPVVEYRLRPKCRLSDHPPLPAAAKSTSRHEIGSPAVAV